MKTTFRLLAALAVVAFLSVSASPLRAAPAHAAVTITIATVDNPQMIDMQHLTPNFTKQYGINVKYVVLPGEHAAPEDHVGRGDRRRRLRPGNRGHLRGADLGQE